MGLTWIVQGTTALIAGIAGFRNGPSEGRGWWIAFGVLSVIAGMVVTATTVTCRRPGHPRLA